MLQSLEDKQGDAELAGASHVQQLFGKLPYDYVANYDKYVHSKHPGASYNLVDFVKWLEQEAECWIEATQVTQWGKQEPYQKERRSVKS